MTAIRNEVEAFVRYMERRGQRLTLPRRKIAEIVFSTHRHFSADDLYAWVRRREKAIGRVTVYRTLALLVESGMVQELSLQKGKTLYEHVCGHPHHDHLICLSCGKVIELHSDHLEYHKHQIPIRRHGFQPVTHSLKIVGYCASCQKAVSARSQPLAETRRILAAGTPKIAGPVSR